jgi:hypothetical protein
VDLSVSIYDNSSSILGREKKIYKKKLDHQLSDQNLIIAFEWFGLF